MAAKKNPLAGEAHRLYKQGMSLVDIARQLEKPEGTVRRWKSTYKWDNERSDIVNERSERRKIKKQTAISDGTDETLQNKDLTPEQQMFCIYYIRTFNATQSYMKAYGCTYKTAHARAYLLLAKVGIKEEIKRLQEIKRQQIVCEVDDLVELNMRIAFADISEYVEFGHDGRGNFIKIKNSEETDTQLIQEIKKGKDGAFSIKLTDRNKAMTWLDRYFTMNPMDKHKQEYDRQKIELELLKLEMQLKADAVPEDEVEDNFIEALNASAKEVWSDE